MGEELEDRPPPGALGQRPVAVALDLRPRLLDQLVVLDARRAGGHARHAAQAAVEVRRHLRRDLRARLVPDAHQHDPPARRVGLVVEDDVARAGRQAEAAVHAVADQLRVRRAMVVPGAAGGDLGEVEASSSDSPYEGARAEDPRRVEALLDPLHHRQRARVDRAPRVGHRRRGPGLARRASRTRAARAPCAPPRSAPRRRRLRRTGSTSARAKLARRARRPPRRPRARRRAGRSGARRPSPPQRRRPRRRAGRRAGRPTAPRPGASSRPPRGRRRAGAPAPRRPGARRPRRRSGPGPDPTRRTTARPASPPRVAGGRARAAAAPRRAGSSVVPCAVAVPSVCGCSRTATVVTSPSVPCEPVKSLPRS